MKRVSSRYHGYTILEVLIFLAVSGGMFLSAYSLFSRQQGNTEFAAAVREFESELSDISNDVSTGFYSSPGSYVCNAYLTGRPDVDPGSSTQGTNQGCTFVGKVINIGENNKPEEYVIYTVVGRRLKVNSTQAASTYAEALPIASNTAGGALIETREFEGGVTAEYVKYNNGAGDINSNAFGFFNSFGVPGVGVQSSGKTSFNLTPIPGVIPADTRGLVISDINNFGAFGPANPSGGIKICLKSGTNDQYALVTLGGSGRSGGTTAVIGRSTVCP